MTTAEKNIVRKYTLGILNIEFEYKKRKEDYLRISENTWLKRDLIKKKIYPLISMRYNIELVNNDVLDEVNFYLSFRDSISFTDLSLILISQKYSAELLTFDKQLLKLYGWA